MVVCHNIAIRADEHPGSKGLFTARSWNAELSGELVSKKSPEEGVLEERTLTQLSLLTFFDFTGRKHVHYHSLGDFGHGDNGLI